MKPRRIRLLDLGLDSAFDASMSFAQQVVSAINAGGLEFAQVEYVRSRDLDTVMSALTAPTDVLHIMGHGDAQLSPSFISSDEKTTMDLEELARFAAKNGQGLRAGCVLADGCKTGTGIWQRAVRNCLQGDITYIGTSAIVGWHDGTVYAGAFYGALLRSKGKGQTSSGAAADAAARAEKAYTILTDRGCPYKTVSLTPSRSARRIFTAT